jgi:hypothetical protein
MIKLGGQGDLPTQALEGQYEFSRIFSPKKKQFYNHGYSAL